MKYNKCSGLSHSSSMSNLNYLPPLNSSFSSEVPTTSHGLISLKKKLNSINNAIHELKISHSKLKLDQEENKNIIKEAIISSRTTGHPIDMQGNPCLEENNKNQNDNEKSSLPSYSYKKLKEKKKIYCIKNEILMNQRMIKEKEQEMNQLLVESKVTRLIEKNNLLLETVNKIQLMNDNTNEIEKVLLPSKEQAKTSMLAQVTYHKSINNALKGEQKCIKENYIQIKNKNNELSKICSTLEERYNNLRFNYNSSKQIENKKIAELNSIIEKKEKIPELKEYIKRNGELYKEGVEEISKIKVEKENTDIIIGGLTEENNKLKNSISNIEKNKKKEMIREKEQYTNIKNKIEVINKEIMQIKSENNSIIVNTDKINATLTKKSNEYIKQVKAKMKKYEIEQNNEYEFISKVVKKLKLNINQSDENMITDNENNTEPNNIEHKREMNKKNSYPAQQLKVVVPKTNPVTPKKPSTQKIF